MRLRVDPLSGMPVLEPEKSVQVFSSSGGGGGGGGTSTGQAWQIDQTPVESPNGARTLFTLPGSEVAIAGTIGVFLNGQTLTHTNDYTETSTTTITFIAIPLTGDIIRLNYRTA